MNAPVDTPSTLASIGRAQPGNAQSGNAHVDHAPLAGRTQLSEQLIGQLIAQQHDLSAVESFSRWHDTAQVHDQPYQALMPAMPPAAGQQYAFEVDLDKCSGCKACVVACHTLNGLGETETWRKVGILTSKAAKLPVLQHVTTACHHCVDPGCLKGCPVLAYEKDPITGIVRHLDDQCFGCKYCTMMCPYEVPQYNESLGIVRKCDMCSQRLEQGEAPACVQACPSQAIKIAVVNRADFERNITSPDQRLVPTAPSSQHTLPTTRFISSALAESPALGQLASRESNEDSVQPGHGPLVGMLVLTQASVGTWAVLTALLLVDLLPAGAMSTVLWLATAMGLIGVQLALLHLGRPWLAFRAFLGWRTSWLSREAIAFGAYLPCVIAGLLAWYHAPPALVVVGATASVIGAVAVACSAMIYVATGRELWSLSRTLGEFTATTIGLGLAIASLAVPLQYQPLALFIAGLMCGAAFIPKWLDWRRSEEIQPTVYSSSVSIRSGRLLHEALGYPWRFAYCSLALSLGTSVFAMLYGCIVDWQADQQLASGIVGLTWGTATAFMFLSQSALRWLGFASVVFPRMPGAST